MKRDEYDALLKQKDEIQRKLDYIEYDAGTILHALGVEYESIKEVWVKNDVATVNYREKGCSCCPSYTTYDFPAAWLFAENGADLAGQWKAEEHRRYLENVQQQAIVAAAEKEAFDKQEFERLKVKFQQETKL